MTRNRIHQQIVLGLILAVLALPGCNDSEPESTPSAAPQNVTSNPQDNPTPTEKSTETVTHSFAPEPAEEFSATPSINQPSDERPTNSSPAIAQHATSPTIGPGYFNGKRDHVVYSTPRIDTLKVSPDGRYVAVIRQVNQDGSLLQVWEIASAETVVERYEPLGVTEVTFSPNNQTLAYGARDRTVVLQPLPEGPAKRWIKHRHNVGGLDFSPDGKLLASLGHGDQLLIWDVNSGEFVSKVIDGAERLAFEVRFVTSDRLWARGSNNKIRWYDFDGRSLVLSQEVELPERMMIFASDDQNLYGRLPDRSLHVVAASQGKDSLDLLVPFPAPSDTETPKPADFFTAGSVAVESKAIGFATADQTLKFWPDGKAEGEEVVKLTRIVSKLATDDAGRFWVAAMQTGELQVIDRDDLETTRLLDDREPNRSLVAPRISSDGRTLVSMQGASTVVSHETETGLVRNRLTAPEPTETDDRTAVTTVVAENNLVCCGTNTGQVQVWNEASETNTTPIPVSESAITALAVSPDGRQVLAGNSEGELFWIDPEKNSVTSSQHEHQGKIRAVRFSPDGQWAVTASDDHSLILWNVPRRSKHLILDGHTEPVFSVAFSPDSLRLISGDQQGHLVLWDAQVGKQVWETTLRFPAMQPQNPELMANGIMRPDSVPDRGISAVAFDRDQRVLAVGTTTGQLQTFDLVNFLELSTIYIGATVSDLKFADDSCSLLVASIPGDVVRLWRTPKPPRMLAGHDGYVRFAALDESGLRAVTGGHDERLCVWDVESGELVESLDNREVISAGALSPDGQKAVTVGFGTGVIFWDLNQMQRLDKRYGHQGRIWVLAFSPDGTEVATGSEDNSVRIWDFATRKARISIPHDDPVRFVKFSPDGRTLLTGTGNERGWRFPGRFQLWDAGNGQRLVEFQGHRSSVNGAVFSEDGKEITSCGADGQVCRWNASTGEQLSDQMRRHGLSHVNTIDDDNHRFLVMRRFSNGVLIDDANTLNRLSEFSAPTRTIGDLNVSGNNRIIAGTQEGPIFVWSLGDE
ncbi:MAG: hypothetical protein HUJ26_17040 [Planctomycetaceae bacterium]|nr:hypothetical protein [Planctomycetaceae bacterium]